MKKTEIEKALNNIINDYFGNDFILSLGDNNETNSIPDINTWIVENAQLIKSRMPWANNLKELLKQPLDPNEHPTPNEIDSARSEWNKIFVYAQNIVEKFKEIKILLEDTENDLSDIVNYYTYLRRMSNGFKNGHRVEEYLSLLKRELTLNKKPTEIKQAVGKLIEKYTEEDTSTESEKIRETKLPRQELR